MTAEEKLEHFYEVSMHTAREEAQKTISEYKETLQSQMEQHKSEKQTASENQFRIKSENAAREINKALSAKHLHIKRRLSKKQAVLKDKLFNEVLESLNDFTKSNEYQDWLESKIREAVAIAREDEMQIYLTASDADLAEEMKKRTGIKPLISDTPFIGGIRAVIPEKNILIDNTFLSAFESEKEGFNFNGGLNHE